MSGPITAGFILMGMGLLVGLIVRLNRQGEQIRTLGQEVTLLRQTLDERLKEPRS